MNRNGLRQSKHSEICVPGRQEKGKSLKLYSQLHGQLMLFF